MPQKLMSAQSLCCLLKNNPNPRDFKALPPPCDEWGQYAYFHLSLGAKVTIVSIRAITTLPALLNGAKSTKSDEKHSI